MIFEMRFIFNQRETFLKLFFFLTNNLLVNFEDTNLHCSFIIRVWIKMVVKKEIKNNKFQKASR